LAGWRNASSVSKLHGGARRAHLHEANATAILALIGAITRAATVYPGEGAVSRLLSVPLAPARRSCRKARALPASIGWLPWRGAWLNAAAGLPAGRLHVEPPAGGVRCADRMGSLLAPADLSEASS
jgi:hypothetical protein